MKKIKILEIGMSTNLGGIETYLYNLVKNADMNKYEFYFLDVSGSKIALEDELKTLGTVVHKITPRSKNYKLHKEELKELYKEGDFDIIHYSLMSYSWYEPILYADRYSSAKIIIHSHNGGFGKNVSLKTRILHRYGKFKTRNVGYAKIACGTKAGKWMFGKSYFDVFYNGIDIDKFSFSQGYRDEIRKKYNIEDNITIIGLVGKLEKQKNHTFLLDIFFEYKKINKKSKLLLIGEGSLQQSLNQKATDLKIIDDVIFVGKVNDSYKYYSAMDVFVMPSLFEGLSIALIEAQANGLKCITSDGVDLDSNITGYVCFYSIREKAEDWAKIIDKNNKRSMDIKMPKEFNYKYSYQEIYEYFDKMMRGDMFYE